MTRALLGLALVACTSFARPTPADTRLLPRDGQGLALSPVVAQQFVRLMRRGVHDQVEPAACVTSWRVWTDTTTHRRNVDVYALTLAETDSADTLNIWWHKTLCGDTLPSVHGHVWRGMMVDGPSVRDSLTAATISRAPFHLLLFRIDDDSTFGVRLYGVRP